MMEIEQFMVGVVGTNCYVAVNGDTKEAFVVDPGDDADALIQYMEKNNNIPQAILLTHGHFDHCMAAEELSGHYKIPVYAHEQDQEIMENPSWNCSGMIGKRLTFHADHFFHGEKDHITLAGFDLEVFHTPGHTPGGVCYYAQKEGILFSGDTLFFESIGRTDFPKGSMGQIVRSIKEKLLVLSDDTKVLTGHGENTTIGNERVRNPFL